jgi:hypothetical protein
LKNLVIVKQIVGGGVGFEIVSQYVAQAGLKLTILLTQPPECWDYKNEPPHLVIRWVSNVIIVLYKKVIHKKGGNLKNGFFY